MKKRRVITVLAAAAVAGLALMSFPASRAAQAGPVPRPAIYHLDGAAITASGLVLAAPPTLINPGGLVRNRAVVRNGTTYSYQWSGYADLPKNGREITYVSTSFIVPKVVKCLPGSSGYAWDSEWAGLDGYSDSTVEQTGVADWCGEQSGSFAWLEMYPLDPLFFTGALSPGNKITVTVAYEGGKHDLYRTVLANLTTGASLASVQPCPSGSTCGNASAEVIEEAPGSGPFGGYNLIDYGKVPFTGTSVKSPVMAGTLQAGSGWSSDRVIMSYPAPGDDLSVPGSLPGNGRNFTVTWKAAG